MFLWVTLEIRCLIIVFTLWIRSDMRASLVSVLIPTYKPGGYIVRCLQSIESQTLVKNRFKVYVALNGSDKSFEAYLKKY